MGENPRDKQLLASSFIAFGYRYVTELCRPQGIWNFSNSRVSLARGGGMQNNETETAACPLRIGANR
jgi:hypothetical protein